MDGWRLKGLAGLCLTGVTLTAAGCTTPQRPDYRIPPPPPPPPAGFRAYQGSTPPVVSPVQAQPATRPAMRVVASHRQYYDQRKQRYYFYDPSRRAYFWEDGEPKT